MSKIEFQKYTGLGNDFIIIDNRDFKHMIKKRSEFAADICRRGESVGADGVIFVENSSIAEFKMVLFQPDGSEAEMCGNGARCLAKYAFENGIAGKQMVFETVAGLIRAEILDCSVSVQLPEPEDFKLNKEIVITEKTYSYDYVYVGVPHVILFFDSIEDIPVYEHGKAIRFHEDLKPAGANVNFIKTDTEKSIVYIRTYERGIENETLACGTGSTASALISALKYEMSSPVTVITKNGSKLKIHFNKDILKKLAENKKIEKDSIELFLEGDASLVYTGILEYR